MTKRRMAVIGCGGMAKTHVERFDSVKQRVAVLASAWPAAGALVWEEAQDGR